MLNLSSLIEMRSAKLSQNPLCKWIVGEESKNLPPQEVLGFAPSMLNFIMGFKDILEELEYMSPKNELEHIVNQHCKEDKDHWRWYLEDLEVLGFSDQGLGKDLSSKMEFLWSTDNKANRQLVYLCIHLIRKYNDARASLVIIECLEATFGVFMTSMQKRFWNSTIYSKLKFFGLTHHHQEANHSIGHWIEDDSNQGQQSLLEQIPFNNPESESMAESIEMVFDQFEVVFENWYLSRNQMALAQGSASKQLEFN